MGEHPPRVKHLDSSQFPAVSILISCLAYSNISFFLPIDGGRGTGRMGRAWNSSRGVRRATSYTTLALLCRASPSLAALSTTLSSYLSPTSRRGQMAGFLDNIHPRVVVGDSLSSCPSRTLRALAVFKTLNPIHFVFEAHAPQILNPKS
jgi:hypothetical protein